MHLHKAGLEINSDNITSHSGQARVNAVDRSPRLAFRDLRKHTADKEEQGRE